MCARKHGPCTTETRDDFIHDEERANFLRNGFDAREELWGWDDIPGAFLYRLDENRRNAPRSRFFDVLAYEVQTEHAAVRIA